MRRARLLAMLALLTAAVPLAGCSAPLAAAADDANCLQVQGTFDPRAPGYIVLYHEGVPVQSTTAHLAAKYGFTPRYIWEAAVQGFAAELSTAAVEVIRCEPVVKRIAHDAVFTAA